ncbi:dehydrogenase [bacterium]|nr:dehydrogenase [bacterium]
MRSMRGYRTEPFGKNRRIVAASVRVSRQRNTIHLVTEVEVGTPRAMIAKRREETGDKLSFTAYLVGCLARVCSEHPRFNSFRKGRRLIVLDDVTVNVLFEREFDGAPVPESVGIRHADRKSYDDINRDIQKTKQSQGPHMGSSSGMGWIRLMPDGLLRAFIRLASRSITMQKKYGVVGVTAIGMFSRTPLWPVPITNATVTMAVGTIVPRVVMVDGNPEEREHVCLTLSFDHDIIDGAPAARFVDRLAREIRSGALLQPM